MNVLMTVMVASVLGAGPDQPPDLTVRVRTSVKRSLPFLAMGAQQWIATKKCSACHHVPVFLWSHYEAEKRNFKIDPVVVANMRRRMLSEYLAHPSFQPTPQDRAFTNSKIGLGAVYLTLGLRADKHADGRTETSLTKLLQHFRKQQAANGSWKLKSSQPPLVDGDDVTTMLILLSLRRKPQSDSDREVRRRSLKWLKTSAPRKETQPIALRVAILARYGTASASRQATRELLARQNTDGGWSQTTDRPSDALATGEALYALSRAGGITHQSAIEKAWTFLTSTQRDDGSWLVHTRNPKGHDEVISYFGTGWATVGLITSLPK